MTFPKWCFQDNFMSNNDFGGDDDTFWDFEKPLDSSRLDSEHDQINCDIVPGNLAQFGLYHGRNNSILDLRTIKTGTLTSIVKKSPIIILINILFLETCA